jgi:hypothetical protein
MKRLFGLILALVMLTGLMPVSALPMQANPLSDGEQRTWFLSDPINDTEFFGEAALEQMGGEIADLLLELDEAAYGEPQDGFPAPPPIPQPPPPPLDMSVYDALGFGNGRTAHWNSKMNDGIVSVSSAYEAAEYVMYRIMVTGSESGWTDSGGGVYSATFRIDTGDNTYLPWSSGANAGKISSQVATFVNAYFPHYFRFPSTASSRTNTHGNPVTDRITVSVTPSNVDTTGGAAALAMWTAEYNEAAALTAGNKNVSAFLDAGHSFINSGDNAQKLKNVHDYLAKSTTYNLRARHRGQPAHCALISPQESVCNGYALATSMLALRMGLNVPFMTGMVPAGLHAWNLNLDEGYPGVVLMVDTTWGRISNTAVRYTFYNTPLSGQPRSYDRYYMSYLAFVNTAPGGRDSLSLDNGMIFEDMAKAIHSLTVRSDGAPTIDLTTETINLAGFTVAGYSVNGGDKWKKGPLPTGSKFTKLFNKRMTLSLTNRADGKGNPEAGGTVVNFPEINARPKTKYRPFYSGTTWTLADSKDKSGKPVTEGIEYADTDGKHQIGAWKDVPHGGFEILSGKQKIAFLVRSFPRSDSEGFTPASRTMRVRPKNFGKAPNVRINEKRGNIISLKKGFSYAIDSTNFSEPLDAKLDLKLEELSGSQLFIKRASTGRRPETEIQTIRIG